MAIFIQNTDAKLLIAQYLKDEFNVMLFHNATYIKQFTSN